MKHMLILLIMLILSGCNIPDRRVDGLYIDGTLAIVNATVEQYELAVRNAPPQSTIYLIRYNKEKWSW